METQKPLFKSKIFWTQIISVLLAVIELLQPNILISLGVPADSEVKVLAIIALVNGILTIVFRNLSTTAITPLIKK